jgi:alpha-1,6-mannosyltransferase
MSKPLINEYVVSMVSEQSAELVGPFLLRHARQTTVAIIGAVGFALVAGPLSWLVIASARSVNSVLVPSGGQSGFPSWMSGPFTGSGLSTGASSVGLAIIIMTLGYAILVVIAPRLPVALLAIGAIISQLVVLFGPPLFSTDAMTYLAYGQEAAHGFNPYHFGPAIDPNNQALNYAGQVWRYTPSVYGPIFTILTTGLIGFGIGTAFWLLKGLTIVSSLAICLLLWDLAGQLKVNQRRAVMLYAANPVVLVFTLGGFHNDLLMLVPVLAGFDLLVRGHYLSGGFLAGLSVGIKLTAAPVLGMMAFVPMISQMKLSWRERLEPALGMIVGIIIMFAITLLIYGRWSFNLIQLLTDQQAQAHSAGTSVLGYLALHHGWQLPPSVASLLVYGVVAFALVFAWFAGRRYLRVDQAAGWLLLLVLVVSQWTLPWYAVTLVALAALGRFWLPLVTVSLCLLLAVMQLQWWGQEVPSTWKDPATTSHGPVVFCQGSAHHLGLQTLTWPTKLRVYGCWDHSANEYQQVG